MSRFIGFVSSYFGNSAVRFNVGILLGLLLNFSYTVFSLIVGIVYEDAWYVSAAAYYTLVAVLRYLLIGAPSERGGQITSQTVSILITILFVPMSGIIMYTVLDERFRIPHRAPVVLFGLYAAFAILRALYGIIFSRKKRFGAYRISNFIRLSLALISLFNFQTSLFSMLGYRTRIALVLNLITGGSASLSMLLLAKMSGKGDSF